MRISISNSHLLQNDSFCQSEVRHSFFKYASQVTLTISLPVILTQIENL